MNKKNFDFFLIAVIILGALSMLPYLAKDTITQGQAGKQIFQAEQAKSYSVGETTGFFPLRHFLEMHHDKIIPWASEFPIYSLSIGLFCKLTGLNVIITGRVFSFIFFILFLWAGYKIGLLFEKEKRLYLFIPLCFILFPVFKLYSISFMPDIPMLSLCAWGIYFSLTRKWLLAAILLCIATLFKYYAAFTTMGIMFFLFFSKSEKSKWRNLIFLGITPIPAILYLLFVFKTGIPNPITEYKTYFGEGHMSSVSSLFNLKLYGRALTWVFIKNPTILGTLMVVVGLFASLKLKILNLEETRILKLLGFLSISGLVFIIFFGSSFYIHDYYGLQIAIITSILAAIGFTHLMIQSAHFKRTYLTVALSITIFFSLSFIATKSSLIEQPQYLKASEKVKEWTKPTDKLLVITDLVTPSVLFYSSRVGWMLNIDLWDMYEKYTVKRLDSSELNSVVVFLRKTSNKDFESIFKFLKEKGWNSIEKQENFPSTHRKVPETDIWLIRKKVI